ncbi:hypothetical protein BC941DRAFT_485546 [Chlamydoabsidia padenii]|nr:hypothetical protein BC941DRAFT_485546 [Chlamydoabsidia padenii]
MSNENNNNNTNMKTAMILGATGAVGKELLKDLLKNGSYTKVVALGRRKVVLDDTIPQDKLVQTTVDFENLEASRSSFRNVNDVYCCLGTTKKDAGSAEKFVKIDQDYVVNSAQIIAEENPVETKTSETSPKSSVHFLYCSSQGADKDSWFTYMKSKGQTEERLKETGFSKVSIFRPGGLELVEPREKHRSVEPFVDMFCKFNNALNLHWSISVANVGLAMRLAATSPSSIPASVKPATNDKSGSTVYTFTNKDMDEMTQKA